MPPRPLHWQRFTHELKSSLQEILVWMATASVARPWVTVVACLGLAATSIIGGVLYGLTMENDGYVLWTPTDSISAVQGNWVRSSASGLPLEGRPIQVILHPLMHYQQQQQQQQQQNSGRSNDNNMLTKDAVRHMFQISEILLTTKGYNEICGGSQPPPPEQDATTTTTTAPNNEEEEPQQPQQQQQQQQHHHQKRRYHQDHHEYVEEEEEEEEEEDSRSLSNSSCAFQSPTLFWNNDLDLFERSVTSDQELIRQMSALVYPISSSSKNGDQQPPPPQRRVHRAVIFGSAHPALITPPNGGENHAEAENGTNDEENAHLYLLESVAAMMVTLELPVDASEAALAYEASVTDRLLQLRQELALASQYRLEFKTQRSFDDELSRSIASDIPFVATAYIMMGAFCAASLFQKQNPVKSQAMLGVGAVFTIVLSLLTGYGLIMLCGVPFTYMLQIFPYVLVGIGLDDTYILMGAFDRTDPQQDMQTRVEHMMRDVGVSITVSTLTTVLAFLLCAFSSLPGFRWFAYYAAPTVLVDFVYQVTFFLALLALDHRRQVQARRDCCPCFRMGVGGEDDYEESSSSNNDAVLLFQGKYVYGDKANDNGDDDDPLDGGGVAPPLESKLMEKKHQEAADGSQMTLRTESSSSSSAISDTDSEATTSSTPTFESSNNTNMTSSSTDPITTAREGNTRRLSPPNRSYTGISVLCCSSSALDVKLYNDPKTKDLSFCVHSRAQTCIFPIDEATKKSACKDKKVPASSEASSPLPDRHIVDRVIDMILRPSAGYVVICIFTGLAVFGTLWATRIESDFDYRDVVPPDSFIRGYHAALDTYFDAARASLMLASQCYFRGIDVSEPEYQAAMFDFVADVSELDIVAGYPSSFWLEDFLEYRQQTEVASETDFFSALGTFLSQEPFKSQYSEDVVRDSNNRVVVSRVKFDFSEVDTTDNPNQVSALKAMQGVSRAQPLNRGLDPEEWPLFTFGPVFYGWELFAVIAHETAQGAILGLLAVFVIAMMFLSHAGGALLVALVVLMVYVELVGFLHLAGIAINTTSSIGLTMSIGLVVDYNMHVVHTFFETKGTSRVERVKKVMNTIGKSVLLGGFSTLLGVLPLAFSQSDVFRTFFFTYLGIVALGTSHGLILTPVLLSQIGPSYA